MCHTWLLQYMIASSCTVYELYLHSYCQKQQACMRHAATECHTCMSAPGFVAPFTSVSTCKHPVGKGKELFMAVWPLLQLHLGQREKLTVRNPKVCHLNCTTHICKSALLVIHRAALAPFLANVTAAPNSYKWILYGDDDTFWFIDNALVYLNQLDPDMPYLLSDNIWMKERTSGRPHLRWTVHCSVPSGCMCMSSGGLACCLCFSLVCLVLSTYAPLH